MANGTKRDFLFSAEGKTPDGKTEWFHVYRDGSSFLIVGPALHTHRCHVSVKTIDDIKREIAVVLACKVVSVSFYPWPRVLARPDTGAISGPPVFPGEELIMNSVFPIKREQDMCPLCTQPFHFKDVVVEFSRWHHENLKAHLDCLIYSSATEGGREHPPLHGLFADPKRGGRGPVVPR